MTDTAFIQGMSHIGTALAIALRHQYQVYVAARQPSKPQSILLKQNNIQVLHWDIEKPQTIQTAVQRLKDEKINLSLVINTQGMLQQFEAQSKWLDNLPTKISPERRIEHLDPQSMLYSYQVNAVVPMMTIAHLWPLIQDASSIWVANISAKLGSIGDNRLGGWYSYRASKAALNMLTKSLAIEFARRHVKGGCIAIHPGTVATPLSDPFVRPNQHRHTPESAATAILKVITDRSISDSGTFWSYNGEQLPW